uniref:Uncharacterized protein n=1 Tax=Glossina morsitans morsitans TaxID=37546 RepID=A0A1B0FN05_GLOMM
MGHIENMEQFRCLSMKYEERGYKFKRNLKTPENESILTLVLRLGQDTGIRIRSRLNYVTSVSSSFTQEIYLQACPQKLKGLSMITTTATTTTTNNTNTITNDHHHHHHHHRHHHHHHHHHHHDILAHKHELNINIGQHTYNVLQKF